MTIPSLLPLLIVLFFIISPNRALSQSNSPKLTNHRIGFLFGYGEQEFLGINLDDKTYVYKTFLFQAQYYYSFLRKRGWSLEVLAQPQYNLMSYKNNISMNEYLSGFEVGVNLGIVIRKDIIRDVFSIYFLLSAGPHFISGTPPLRQVSGFIFSDNLSGGVSIHLDKTIYLDLRMGWRHLSNAELQFPNRGINSIIIQGGIFYIVPKSARKND